MQIQQWLGGEAKLVGKPQPWAMCVTETRGPEKLPVLLIEDNEEFRNYLKNNLSTGYKIIEAANGKGGLAKSAFFSSERL